MVDRMRKATGTAGRKRTRRDKAMANCGIADVPDGALSNIFGQLQFPYRFTAMQVCKRWQAIAAPKVLRVKHSIGETIEQAQAGDTISVPVGFYPELVLVDRPLKMVGERHVSIVGDLRRGVVLQTLRPTVALCNARCCFENIVFRAAHNSIDRSVIAFGPSCDYIRLQGCEVSGGSGILLPSSKGADTQLVLTGCHIHSIDGPSPAINVETGWLVVKGCTITNCSVAIDVLPEAVVDIRNNDISFNGCGVAMDGRGTIQDNVMWGNFSAFNMSAPAADQAVAQLAQANEMGAASSAADDPPQGATPSAAAASTPAAQQEGGSSGEAEAADGQGGVAENGGAARRSTSRTRAIIARQPPASTIKRNHVRMRVGGEESPNQRAVTQKVRRLTRQVYGHRSPDYEDWQVIGASDLDSDSDGSDANIGSSSDDSSGSDDDSMYSGSSGDYDDEWMLSDDDEEEQDEVDDPAAWHGFMAGDILSDSDADPDYYDNGEGSSLDEDAHSEEG